jgi:hypothetical protein
MINVILDASVICADFYLRSPDARILRDSIGKAVRGIFVPQVALWEILNQNREATVAAVAQHDKYAKELARLTQSRPRSPDPKEISHEYFIFLNALLQSPGFAILGVPEVSHEEIVMRDLRRRKPFAPTGKGYRDCLIWHTILFFAKSSADEVVFVTKNVADFALNGALHPDLVEDLADGQIPGRVQLFTDLKEFNSSKILPLLEPHERTKNELVRGTLEGFNLRKWFAEKHLGIVVPGDIMILEFGVSDNGFEARFIAPPELLSITPKESRILNSGDFFVLVDCKVRERVHISSDFPAFHDDAEVGRFWARHAARSGNYGDYSMDHDAEISVELAIVLEKGTHRLLSAEQISATGAARTAGLHPPATIE